ncbi:MAG: hypothetical protein KDK26_11810 [Roseivivax sp.]|nr:hypothetical protein [Roseivivax sp.]
MIQKRAEQGTEFIHINFLKRHLLISIPEIGSGSAVQNVHPRSGLPKTMRKIRHSVDNSVETLRLRCRGVSIPTPAIVRLSQFHRKLSTPGLLRGNLAFLDRRKVFLRGLKLCRSGPRDCTIGADPGVPS